MGSYTYFKRATTVAGLAYAREEEVIMHPANSPQVQSMGTQFRFLLEVEKDKWVFQGGRHPSEDPANFDYTCGAHVMAPVKFINGVPHVYWKEVWDWSTFNY